MNFLDSLTVGAEITRALAGDPDTTSLEVQTFDLGITPKNKIEMPLSINSETSIKCENDPSLTKQRTNVKIGNLEIDYDLNPSSGDINPADVLRVSVPQPFNIGSSKLMAYDVGNFSSKDLGALEFYKALKLKNMDLGIDWGLLFQKGMNPSQWTYGKLSNKKFYAMLASMYPNNITKANMENSDFFTNMGVDFGKAYATFGASTGPRYNVRSLTANTHSNEDFGTLGLAVYDPKSDKFFFKTRTAVGDVAQNFYSAGFSNYCNELFVFPPFFFPHFSPPESKGNNTLMIDGSGIKGQGLDEIEVRVGRKTKFGRIGAGVYSGENGPVPAFMYYTPFKVGDVNGSVEITGNSTKGFSAYLTGKTNFGRQ